MTPEPPAKLRRPGPGLANLCFFLAVLVFLVISLAADLGNWGFVVTSLAGEFSLVMIALLFCLFGRFNFRETFSLRRLDLLTLFLCFLAGLTGQLAVRFPAALNQWVMQIFGPFPTQDLIPIPRDELGRYLFFLVVVISAPLCEEILNRGFVLAGYRPLGFGRTIFYVGLLFGLFHLYPFRFGYTFLLGMAMAYLVLVTGSIFSSIMAHVGFNLIGGLAPWIYRWLENISPEETRNLLEEADDVTLSTLMQTWLVSLFAAALFFLLLRKITTRMSRQRPELELGYLGLARGFKPGQPQPSGPYFGPDPRHIYGPYGYLPAAPSAPVEPDMAEPQPAANRPGLPVLARTWWQLSFLAIFLLYGLTTFSEIALRLRNGSGKVPQPPPAPSARILPASDHDLPGLRLVDVRLRP